MPEIVFIQTTRANAIAARRKLAQIPPENMEVAQFKQAMDDALTKDTHLTVLRQCRKCGEQKPDSEFAILHHDGCFGRCLDCD